VRAPRPQSLAPRLAHLPLRFLSRKKYLVNALFSRPKDARVWIGCSDGTLRIFSRGDHEASPTCSRVPHPLTLY
jgi:hypothetical protein